MENLQAKYTRLLTELKAADDSNSFGKYRNRFHAVDYRNCILTDEEKEDDDNCENAIQEIEGQLQRLEEESFDFFEEEESKRSFEENEKSINEMMEVYV